MLKPDHQTPLTESVLHTLLYFDIFQYPLNASEVYRFLHRNSVTLQHVAETLDDLVARQLLTRNGELYSLRNDHNVFSRRKSGNEEAQRQLPVAQRRGRLISRFPFVRAVMVSGSLSKNYMDKDSDLDFFIITSPGRLWICRTLLVLFKRLFLGNSHKQFCVNYFVAADHLHIEEKNLFTATELVTLIPLYGTKLHEQLMKENGDWIDQQFPNFDPTVIVRGAEAKTPPLKMFLEAALNVFGGSALDRFCMRLSQRRWLRLYGGDYPSDQFNIAFKSTPHVSKNHPRNFQAVVMQRYAKKVEHYRTTFPLAI